MDGPIPGSAIGAELIQALGLPAETTLLQIRIAIDEPVEVLCRYYPSGARMTQVLQVLQRYHCVPDGPPQAVDNAPGAGPRA